MTSKKFYHGSPYRIEKFEAEFMEIGTQQFGSGFYFTDRKHSAQGYCESLAYKTDQLKIDLNPTTHTCVISDMENPLDSSMKGALSLSEVICLIKRAPELDDVLWNFGDYPNEGKNKVIIKAADLYTNLHDEILKTLNTLSNDFFKGHALAFNHAVKEILGYDGVIVNHKNGEQFVIAFFPEQVEIIKREPHKKLQKSKHDPDISPS